MGKWLAKFSADIPKSLPDIPDIVEQIVSVSGLSVPDLEVSAKHSPLQAADEPTPPLGMARGLSRWTRDPVWRL